MSGIYIKFIMKQANCLHHNQSKVIFMELHQLIKNMDTQQKVVVTTEAKTMDTTVVVTHYKKYLGI